MTKSNPLYRAAAMAAAATGACLLALACPGAAAASGSGHAEGRGENTLLNLGSSAGSTHSSGTGGASIVRTIVGLAIVIAVIWGLSWILKQVKTRRGGLDSPSTGLSSIAALPLSSGRSVHLVRAGSDYLLLGSAEHGVIPIHRYSEEEAREAGLLDVIDVQPRPRRALLRPPSGGSGGGEGTGSDHDPMSMPAPGPGSSLIDKLRELTVRR
jgi:flagellar protein FliO/FliZ